MKKFSIIILGLLLGASLAAESSMKCGAGKCGGAKAEKKVEKKDTSMKCGAGRCGSAKKKSTQGKCGSDHMKQNAGKCD